METVTHGKRDRGPGANAPATSRAASIQVALEVVGVAPDVRHALRGLCIATGLQVLQSGGECETRSRATWARSREEEHPRGRGVDS